ncbi:hypothetical protein [Novosphingobium sp. KN65.2]|uniref:hypothetical protein n=1 Tax=Novosphingobium sp. KN65.2 TaxID=1478134 RepID=UPI0005E5D751|nr:hypothetical protein [Novosphingobium sp. KN65.2]CDO35080.1 hypothetical protein SPHV1_2190017 [Novosphingobium sp. KN65.2]
MSKWVFTNPPSFAMRIKQFGKIQLRGVESPLLRSSVEFLGRVTVRVCPRLAPKGGGAPGYARGFQHPAQGRGTPPTSTEVELSLKPYATTAAIILAASITPLAQAKVNVPLVALSDLGPQPTDVQAGVRQAAQTFLKDPFSAEYQIGPLYPGYCKGRGKWDVQWKGWATNVLINARNSYGGYTGYQVHTVLFDGDRGVRIIKGENFGAYGPSKGLLGGGAGVCQIITR